MTIQTFPHRPQFGWAIAPLLLLYGPAAIAQIVPDGSLGAESSIVSAPAPNAIQIDGGATRGANLFHSFQEFSIPTGQTARFDNAAGIANILTRVTGSNISQIDGLLQANGTANLFLLNPNGIVFGPEARLAIGGSFAATTAESLNFDDGSAFGAIAPSDSLLTIRTPIGLRFGDNPGAIVHRSQAARLFPPPGEFALPANAGLEVAPGRSLALLGGSVFLESGNLSASQGQVLLGSVAGPGTVTLEPIPTGFSLNYQEIANFGTIALSGTAAIDVSGTGGGVISLRGGNIIVRDDASLLATTFGDLDGRGIEITGDRLQLQNDALISTATFGAGDGGDLTFRASESVDLSGSGFAAVQEFQLTVIMGAVDVNDATFGILTATQGEGRAGTATIETRNLVLREGTLLSTSTVGPGMGADAIVRAETIAIDASLLLASTGIGSTGDSGSVVLEAQTLSVVNGGIVLAATLGAGAAGKLLVRATDLVEIARAPENAIAPSGLSSSSLMGTGRAGNIEVDARRIEISGGTTVASQSGEIVLPNTLQQMAVDGGPGGNIFLNAIEAIEVRDGATVSATSLGNSPAGSIHIEAGELVVREEGSIDVAGGLAGGTGDAGTLTIAADSVHLEDGGGLSASTASGLGGNIAIQTGDLRLRGRSKIATNAGDSDGGNIAIAADTLVALTDSDITANAQEGFGGRVEIEAAGIFGTAFRTVQTPDSDITATSALGVAFGGTVDIDELEADPGSTLVELPDRPIDATALFDRDPCRTGSSAYAIVGRGGLPPNPLDSARFSAIATEWEAAPDRRTQAAGSNLDVPEEIVEATGWETDRDGNVVALRSRGNGDRERWHRRDRCANKSLANAK